MREHSVRRDGLFSLMVCGLIAATCSSNPTAPAAGGGGGVGGSTVSTQPDAGPAPTTPTVSFSGSSAKPISPAAFGQNYWSWVAAWGNGVSQVQAGVKDMKLNVLRAGGHNNDVNTPEGFDSAHVDTYVAYARAVGAEPILQVPFLKDPSGIVPTAQTAADMVTYANKTKTYGIKYWQIGNEPDLYPDTGDMPKTFTAADFCTAFAAFADAMKAVDPTIQVIGPDLSWKYIPGNDWLTPFLDGCASKVDIVAVHRYPFAPTACTLPSVMADGANLRGTISNIRAKMKAHGLTNTPLAITEANVTYDQGAMEASPGTFYGGLWVAEALGISLEQDLWTTTFWSLNEGYPLGFFTDKTNLPKPPAHAFELFSQHFGPTILQATTVPTGVSAYGSRDDAGKKTVALLINRTDQDRVDLIAFDALSVPVGNQPVTLPAYSLTLLEIPDDGAAVKVLRYTKDMADQGLAPQPQN